METGVAIVVYLHEALDNTLLAGSLTDADIHDAAIEGVLHRLRPKLMTVFAVSGQSCADPVGIGGNAGSAARVQRSPDWPRSAVH
jgi:Cu/Ag efflux pump CusA